MKTNITATATNETGQASKAATSPGAAGLMRSYVLIGTLMFIALELLLLGLSKADPKTLGFDPVKSPNMSWVWWNVRDFRQLKQAPDIVLLGSSLMMAPLHGGDAAYLKVGQNVALHHRSILLEDLLKKTFGESYRTFAFALGGEMVSDAYAISATMLKGDRKPQTIIYGIAPRDFMDHALPSPASTEIFKYMDRVGDLSAIEKDSYGSFWERAEHQLSKLSFIYKHRPDFIYIQQRWAKSLAHKLLGYGDLEKDNAPLHIRKQAFLELPENHGPASLFVDAPGEAPEPFDLNLNEYRFRYRKINVKQFNCQLSFLEKLLTFCKKENINIILVNMPLTQDNLALMQPGFYQGYLDKVSALSTAYGASLIDMNDPKLFQNKHFLDSVHLNSRGGQHFFEVMVDKINKDSRAVSITKNSGHPIH